SLRPETAPIGLYSLSLHDALPICDVLLRDQQHPAGATARVVDAANRALRADPGFVASQHQINHEVHDVARCEVLAGVLVQRFVEDRKSTRLNSSHVAISYAVHRLK